MTGNVALDVVIGLVFVYLLYSLYASILMELISSVLGLRAKNLKYTLKRMLGDEKVHPRGWNWLAKIGTTFIRSSGLAPNQKNMELYETFLKQPNIKYLGSGGFGGRPSYLSSENFSKGLIDSIKVDVPELSLMQTVEIGIATNLREGSETRMHLESMVRDSQYDPVKFKVMVENWFNDTMDRSIGWFKQTTQTLVLIIGLMLTVGFNIDSFAIIKKLSKDKNAREQMVNLATRSAENKNSMNMQQPMDSAQVAALQSALEEEIENSQNLLQSSWHLPDEVIYQVVHIDTTKQDSLITKSLHKDSVKFMLNDGTGFAIVHKSLDTARIKKQIGESEIDLAKLKEGDKIAIKPFWYKLGYILSGGRLWGYLLTILALSLGAPFWFDLLNKLVKLRTGKRIDENGATANATDRKIINSQILNRVG